MASVRAVVLVVLLMLGRVSLADPLPNATLRALFVMHRHGARLPMPPANASYICGNYCGQLTTSGADMLFQLGRWVLAEYPQCPFDDKDMRGVVGNSYNPHTVTTRSTDVDRTIQSADAFLRGLLLPRNDTNASTPTTTGFLLPAIHTVPQAQDYEMLVWASWPSLIIESTVTQDSFNVMMNGKIHSLFAPGDYAKMGVEMHLESLCAAQPFQCALAAQDIITCAVSNGQASRFPFLLSKYNALTQVMVEYNAVSMYNASGDFDLHIGAKGYPLAMMIVSLMKEALAMPADAPPLFRELSGHDITLMPFAEAIGNQSFTNPVFGGAYVIELWQRVDKTAVVRLRYGEPSQAFDSGYLYSFYYASLEAFDVATGRVYRPPPEEGCELGAWEADLALRAPKSNATWCSLPLAILQQIDCLPGSTNDTVGLPSTGWCATYRQECPKWACLAPHFDAAEQEYFLSATGVCVKYQPTAPSMCGTTAGMWGLAPWQLMAGSAAAMLLLCVVVGVALHVWFVRRAEAEQQQLESQHQRSSRHEESPTPYRGRVSDASDDDDGLGGGHDEGSSGCCLCLPCCGRRSASTRSAPNVSASSAVAVAGGQGVINEPTRQAAPGRGVHSPLLHPSGGVEPAARAADVPQRRGGDLTSPPPLKATTPRRRLEHDTPSDDPDSP